jgi:hypothetical protein
MRLPAYSSRAKVGYQVTTNRLNEHWIVMVVVIIVSVKAMILVAVLLKGIIVSRAAEAVV